MVLRLRLFATSNKCDSEQLDAFIDQYDLVSLRETLVEMATYEEVDDELLSFVCAIFDRIGLGAIDGRLVELLEGKERPTMTRILAFEILLRAGFFGDDLRNSQVDAELLSEFHTYKLKGLLRCILVEPKKAEFVEELLQTFDREEERVAFFLLLEDLRQEERLAACIAYRYVLANSTDPCLQELALGAIEKEGGIVGRSVLESLRCTVKAPSLRRQIGAALDRWQYPIRMAPQACGLTAWMSPCDEFGIVVARFVWHRPDGFRDVATFNLNVTSGMFGHECALKLSAEAFSHKFTDNLNSRSFVEMPSGVGAQIVVDSRKSRMAHGRKALVEAEAMMARLETVMTQAPVMSLALADPVHEDEIADFLRREPYRHWLDPKIVEGDCQELCACLTYMSHWHRYRGERRLGEIAAILAQKPALAINSCLAKKSGTRIA
ncbi:MAG: hypothetical protein ACI97A_002011 [Planctomycetota bacterium]|jgi:hypothetical protein